jgi:hypothetical protein
MRENKIFICKVIAQLSWRRVLLSGIAEGLNIENNIRKKNKQVDEWLVNK